MSDQTPEDRARVVWSHFYYNGYDPISWIETIAAAIRDAEARGERRGLKRASEEAMNHSASCGYECCGGHGTAISSAIAKLIPAEPGSTA